MRTTTSKKLEVPPSRSVSISLSEILKKVDELTKPGLRNRQSQLDAEDYIEWRRQFQDRQHDCIMALQKAFGRLPDGQLGREGGADARFDFRLSKKWIIRLPKAATFSIPAALATAIAVLAFEHGQGYTGGSLSVTALSGLFAALGQALVKLEEGEAQVVDIVMKLMARRIVSSGHAGVRVKEILELASRNAKMTNHKAQRVLDTLIAKQVLKVVSARPKCVRLAV